MGRMSFRWFALQNPDRNALTRIHLNPIRASVRPEIETFLDARQSSLNPYAVNIGSLDGQKGVCVALVEVIWQQRVPNVARLVREAKVMMARERARKANQAKAKPTMAKEKAKVASGMHERYLKGTATTVGNGVTWNRIVSRGQKPKGEDGRGKSASSLDETEANGLENTSVVWFGLCSFGNHYDDWPWNNCHKVTLDSGGTD